MNPKWFEFRWIGYIITCLIKSSKLLVTLYILCLCVWRIDTRCRYEAELQLATAVHISYCSRDSKPCRLILSQSPGVGQNSFMRLIYKSTNQLWNWRGFGLYKIAFWHFNASESVEGGWLVRTFPSFSHKQTTGRWHNSCFWYFRGVVFF